MAIVVGSERGVQANINMTPMIDILLVLLIIFMAISPTASKGLSAVAPQAPADAATPPDETAVVIGIDRTGKWRLNAEEFAEERVEERLLEIFSSRARRVVFVKGDPALDYQTVARAIDHAHGANIDTVGLVTPKFEAVQ